MKGTRLLLKKGGRNINSTTGLRMVNRMDNKKIENIYLIKENGKNNFQNRQ